MVCDQNFLQESKESEAEEYKILQEYVKAGLATVVDCIWVMNSVSEFQPLNTADYLLDTTDNTDGNGS